MPTADCPVSPRQAARRRRVADARIRRELFEKLLEHRDHLAPADRATIEHLALHGGSLATLARAADRPIRTFQARLLILLRRVRHPVTRFMLERPDLVCDDLRAVGLLWAFQRLSIRTLSRRLGLSVHAVRSHLHDLATLARLWGYR